MGFIMFKRIAKKNSAGDKKTTTFFADHQSVF